MELDRYMNKRHRIYPPVLLRSRELRHPQTPAEATLWRHLRSRNHSYKFRRQHPLDRFIVDFYCAEAKLCIEIDGSSHFEAEQEEYDKERTEFLESRGFQVIRFTNNDVRYNINAVVDEVVRVVEKRILELKKEK
ncbi:MAG: endonuclease domain-containing protein [Bacteroidales bacterium]|nr:endonuclease domain-containing protein [Bacteroidales bacterium]